MVKIRSIGDKSMNLLAPSHNTSFYELNYIIVILLFFFFGGALSRQQNFADPFESTSLR
jgi:hypothetical protein